MRAGGDRGGVSTAESAEDGGGWLRAPREGLARFERGMMKERPLGRCPSGRSFIHIRLD
jgi:hypothetical protein